MTTTVFLAEWAFRSAALIACGALLLWVLRVKDASIRLAAWMAMLAGSLAIPLLTFRFPGVPVTVMTMAPVDAPVIETFHALEPVPRHFDWWRVALMIYAFVALVLLLRLCIGLVMSLRLLRAARETGRMADGIPVLESDHVTAPVTLGIIRPKIVLPFDWRAWDDAKLSAVLAHERSHIRRADPALQVLSAIHRAILWHSPMSWFLHRSIVRTAEEASDDAAVAVTQDRAFYAEVLLEFLQRGTRRASWLGVPMARYGRVESRIHRILDGRVLSRGITRWGATAIVAIVLPLVYVTATVHASQAAPQPPPARQAAPAPTAAPRPTAAARRPRPGLTGLGTVTATTLMVRSKIDGELKSLGFEEGKPVEAGQLLATVEAPDAGPSRPLADARQKLADIQALYNPNHPEYQRAARAVQELEYASLHSQIRAPFAGVAGLRKVDPGNLVHAGDLLVVISQLQPIAVLFTIPEDNLPGVLTRFRTGAVPTVEAWNRDNSAKLATGTLTAIDNEIDKTSGMATLKATFDNKDGALFPGQFVNARVLLAGR